MGQLLTDTLVVRLTDSRDRPVQSQLVEFRLIAGGTGADLIPDTAVTNADGQARSAWLLGRIAGQQRVEARVLATGAAGGLKSTFTATAVADQPDTMLAVKGQGQSGVVGAPLNDSLAVAVVDRFGNPVAGETVNWSVPPGEGSVSSTNGTTGADGRTAVVRTLGGNAGAQSATATAASLPSLPIVFDHTASASGAVAIVKLSPDNQQAPAGFQLADSIVVQVQDANGNGVPGRNVNWVASGNGSAAPTSSVTDATGKAFTFWTLSTTAGVNTLTVAVAGLPQVQYNATGSSATPTTIQNQSSTTPTGIAGQPAAPVPSVKVTDQNNNPVQGVTVTFQVTQGGGQVSDGTGTGPSASISTDAAGLATLAAWVLGPTVGTNQLTASASGSGGPLTGSPVTFTATATAGQASKLVFTQQPGNTVAGAAITPAVAVAVQDANGNTLVGSTAAVTLAIGTNPGGGALSGTLTVNASGGIATFPGLSINRTGRGYTLTASSAGVSTATSATFDILAGAAAKLAFVQQPTTTPANQPITPAVTVAIQDALGNTVTASTAAVKVDLGNNPSGAILSGTVTRNAVAGIATFTDLSLDKTGAGYTLAATSTGLTGATSAGFSIASGAAVKLAFQTGPTTTAAGAQMTPPVTVVILDASGNPVTTASDSVVLAIGTNPGTATLSGTVRRAAVNGVATFDDLSLNRTGTGYTLTAADPAGILSGATSGAFDVTLGAGHQLAFQVQPGNVAAGSVITPAVVIRAEDGLGNLDTSFTAGVTVALGNNPGGASLGGTLIQSAVAGVATFNDLTLNRTGTGYTLTASTGGFTGATSSAFNVVAGAPSSLSFTTQPGNTVAGSFITPAPQVTVLDAQGNVVLSPALQLTMAIGNNAGGGTLTGTLTVSTTAGVATFSDLEIDNAATGYTLQVTGGGLPAATSAAFDIQVGGGNRLAFLVQPSNTSVGAAITPAIQVEIQDGVGNRVVTATDQVTLVFGNNPNGASLVGTTQVAAVAGVATFSSVAVNRAGTGYTLSALASGLVSTTSTAFDVSPTATTTSITGQSAATTLVGQSYTVSYNVTSSAGMPPGNVTVSDGIDSCTATAAAGSCVLTSTTAGSKSLVATFTDPAGNFQTSSSSSLAHTVNKGSTTLVFSDTPDPTVVGQPITTAWNLTIASPAVGTLTGSVTVTVTNGSETCSAPVAAGSCQLVLLTRNSGNRTITATYPGDANFNGSSDGDPHVISRAATTTTIGPVTPASPEFGQPISVAFTVTPVPPGGGTPTGTVTVSSNLGGSCSAAANVGSCTMTPTSSGAQTLTASFAQDGNYTASTSSGLSLTVNPAATTTAIVSDNPDPSGVGQAIAVSVQVSAQFATPTGSVSVDDGAGASCTIAALSGGAGSCNLTPIVIGTPTITATYTPATADFVPSSGTAGHTVTPGATTTTITAHTPSPSVTGQTVNVSVTVAGGAGTPTGTVVIGDGTVVCLDLLVGGNASCPLTFTTAGARTITANYGGDANFQGSSGNVAHTVNPAATTTSITGDTPDPSTAGSAYTVTYGVAVTAPGAGTPTGNVTVSDGTSNCVGTVAAGSCSLTSTTAGAKNLTATYAGNANFSGSVSATAAHTVDSAATTTTITSDTPDPSSVGGAVAVGFTVTSGFGTPGGTVTVSDGVNNCNGTLSNGSGSCNITLTVVGSRPLTARYNGDAAHATSLSAAAPHTVNQQTSSTSITAHTPDPSVVNQQVAVTVTVTGAGVTPTGTVDVSDGSGATCQVTLSGGTGSCNITLPTAGARTLTAQYNGDGVYSGSSGTAPHTVNPAATTTTITGDTPDPSTAGSAYTVTYGVAVTAPGAGTPTGNVTVSDGTSNCVGTVAAGSCSLTSTTAGAKNLTATYAGNANFSGSVSATAAHTVDSAATTTTITSDTPDPSPIGSAVAVSFTVTSGFGTPGGTVTVSDGVNNCNGTLSNGSGSCNITLTVAGSRPLTAHYNGDAAHATSTSAAAPHTVNLLTSSTSITAHTPDPSVVNQPVAVSVTVTGAGATPTGTVDVSDGSGATCQVTLSGGTGSCNITLPTAGARTLTAQYNGDGLYAASSGNTAHTVNAFGPADPTTTTAIVPAGNVSQPTNITVQLRDAFGNNITVGAAGTVAGDVTSGPNAPTSLGVTDNNDGTFTLTYTPAAGAGTDIITITLNGTGISGSPYSSAIP